MAAADEPGIRAGQPLDRHGRIQRLVKSRGLRPRRGVRDQHERVLDSQAALGGQAPKPVQPLVAERLVRPFGGVADGVGHALQPGKRRRPVEIGDRDGNVTRIDQCERIQEAVRLGTKNVRLAA